MQKPIDTLNDERLPRIPVITDEQQKEIDADQAKRSRLINISSSPSQRDFARAHAIISSYEVYTELPASAVRPYAEALVTAGRYKDAYDLTGEQLYLDIDNALNNDVPKCDCPDTTSIELVNGQPMTKTYSRFFIRKKVYSITDSAWHDLMVCNVCGRIGIWHDDN